MLNKNGERELAYLVQVDSITPMNADRLECAHIGGWHCVVGKGDFVPGAPAVYFEVDSRLPDEEPFSGIDFLRSKDFKIKTQKIRGEYSQGLLIPVSAFGWTYYQVWAVGQPDSRLGVDDGKTIRFLDDESRFLTKELNVTYADPDDNKRKAPSYDPDKATINIHKKFFKRRFIKWLMKNKLMRKILLRLFRGKAPKKTEWPAWVKKTDEERIQNCPEILNLNGVKWIATEKIDGTSTTFTLRFFKGKPRFIVCSRNVAFSDGDNNVYTSMARKYDIESVMKDMFEDLRKETNELEFITIQAETFGPGVQRRTYSQDEPQMAVFNLIYGYKDGHTIRLNPIRMTMILGGVYEIPTVPVLGYVDLPKTCEEVLAMAAAEPSKIDGGMREGIVFRSDDGVHSFKAVNNEYLLKYHS